MQKKAGPTPTGWPHAAACKSSAVQKTVLASPAGADIITSRCHHFTRSNSTSTATPSTSTGSTPIKPTPPSCPESAHLRLFFFLLCCLTGAHPLRLLVLSSPPLMHSCSCMEALYCAETVAASPARAAIIPSRSYNTAATPTARSRPLSSPVSRPAHLGLFVLLLCCLTGTHPLRLLVLSSAPQPLLTLGSAPCSLSSLLLSTPRSLLSLQAGQAAVFVFLSVS